MSAHNDGGPAFPHRELNDDGTHHYSHPGESLRDRFAGQAMVGLLIICVHDTPKDGRTYAAHVAANAYQVADAMLAERAKAEGRAP